MPVDPTDPDYREFVQSITYRPRTRVGYLKLARGYPPSMEDTIRLFTQIDPTVRTILCYDGRHLNTRYSKFSQGWECTLYEPMTGPYR